MLAALGPIPVERRWVRVGHELKLELVLQNGIGVLRRRTKRGLWNLFFVHLLPGVRPRKVGHLEVGCQPPFPLDKVSKPLGSGNVLSSLGWLAIVWHCFRANDPIAPATGGPWATDKTLQKTHSAPIPP